MGNWGEKEIQEKIEVKYRGFEAESQEKYRRKTVKFTVNRWKDSGGGGGELRRKARELKKQYRESTEFFILDHKA